MKAKTIFQKISFKNKILTQTNFNLILSLFLTTLSVQLIAKTPKNEKQNINEITNSQNFIYKDKNVELEGYLALPPNIKNAKVNSYPAILLIHEWTGLGDYIKKRADMFAELGYIVFAMDMYGKNVRPKNHEEAAKVMSIYEKNYLLMNERMQVSLDQLRKNKYVNIKKIFAIGYCFGGGAALRLGYSGANLKGIVTFHGMLKVPVKQEAKNIKTSGTNILVHHGGADKFIPANTIKQFKDILNSNKVKYEFISYEGAVHGFTRWGANENESISYNKNADEKSWTKTIAFLKKLSN